MPKCPACGRTIQYKLFDGFKTPCDLPHIGFITDDGNQMDGYILHSYTCRKSVKYIPEADQRLEDAAIVAATKPEQQTIQEVIIIPPARKETVINETSFYRWYIDKYGKAKTPDGTLARRIQYDEKFPNKTRVYNTVREYIEKNYDGKMVIIFEQVWDEYKVFHKEQLDKKSELIQARK